MYLEGRFEEAIELFQRSLAALSSTGENGCGPVDAMAWVRITQGLPEEAHLLLDQIDQLVRSETDRGLYVFRYALLTRVCSLLRQREWAAAFAAGRVPVTNGWQVLTTFCSLAHVKLCCAQALSRLVRVHESLTLRASVSREMLNLPRGFMAPVRNVIGIAADSSRVTGPDRTTTIEVASLHSSTLHNRAWPVELEWNRQFPSSGAVLAVAEDTNTSGSMSANSRSARVLCILAARNL